MDGSTTLNLEKSDEMVAFDRSNGQTVRLVAATRRAVQWMKRTTDEHARR